MNSEMTSSKQQKLAFAKLSKIKVGALFMEMGTGKTKVALDLINSRAHKLDYILWICPFSLKDEIEVEKLKWYPNMELNIVGCESIGQSDRIYLEVLNELKSSKCAFVVVDESLKIKNIRAKRTKRILSFSEHSQYRLILNGTPISKNILDVWTQIQFLSPKILNMTFSEFKDHYCEYYTCGELKGKIKNTHNVSHLISLIEPYIFECKLELDTKKNYYQYYYCVNNFVEYEEYKFTIFDEYFDNEELNFNAFSMALQKWYCDYANTNKEKVLDDVLDMIDGQAIIFVRYLSSIPDGAKSITGVNNNQERKQIIEDFKNGKFEILYITYGCGAYGLNLQFCRNIIFSENTWDYAQRIQAEARIYRIGQLEEVNYYDLICSDIGLEKLIKECVGKKESLLNVMKTEISKVKGGIKEWVKSI